VIPAELRRRYGLRPGSQVHIVDYGGGLAIVPVADDPVRQAVGMLATDKSLAEVLLAEHRAELGDER